MLLRIYKGPRLWLVLVDQEFGQNGVYICSKGRSVKIIKLGVALSEIAAHLYNSFNEMNQETNKTVIDAWVSRYWLVNC